MFAGNPKYLFVGVQSDPIPPPACDRINLSRRSSCGEGESEDIFLAIIVNALEHSIIQGSRTNQNIFKCHESFLFIEDSLIHPRATVYVKSDEVTVLF